MTSLNLNDLGRDAELLFYRLLVLADDQGRFIANQEYLRSAAFPLRLDYTPPQIVDSLRQLVEQEIISLYLVDGRQFAYFREWKKHQRIRNVRPKYPDPKDSDSLDDPPQSADIIPQAAAESAPNPNPNPNLNLKEEEREEDFAFELDVVELFDQTFPKKPHLQKPIAKTATGLKTLKQIRARRKERKWGEEPGPWVSIFNECKKSEFLMIKFAGFDLQWLTEKSKMEKTERGNYKDSPGAKGSGRGVAADKLTDGERKKFDDRSK